MSRNPFAPNWIRDDYTLNQKENLPERTSRTGRVPHIHEVSRGTEAWFTFASGEDYIAHILIYRQPVPEIPDLQILDHVPWNFYDVISGSHLSDIRFLLHEDDAHYLKEIVVFYDFLYGG